MGLIKRIKKLSIIVIVFSMVSVMLSGCVYYNNKNWDDMTTQEKQEAREQFQKDKEEWEQENTDDDFEDKLGSFILDIVEGALDN